jgi:hypothetical protein
VRNRFALILVAVLVSAFVAASCGGADEKSQGLEQQAAQQGGQGEKTLPQTVRLQDFIATERDKINGFLSGLGELPVPEPTPPLATGPSVPSQPVSSYIEDHPSPPPAQVRYNCTTTPYTMSTNPDKIVTLNPDAGKLWLGSLLQGSGYARGLGSLKALPIGHRAPLKVYMNLLDPSVSQTVNNPDAASMQEAIGSLATEAEQQGKGIPNVGAFQQETASTTKQGMLSLGFSAKYLGAKAYGNLDTSKDVKTSTVMAALQQRFFTVSFVTPPTPADYFTSDATISDFREQADLGRVSVGNPPVVVSSISYGRIFIMTASSQTTADKLKAAMGAEFSAATAGGKVEMTAEQKAIMENATFDVISLGGDEAAFLQAVKSHNIDAFLANPTNITNAHPISYQVDNLSTGSAAAFTETANYNLTTCAAQAGRQEMVGSIVKLTNLSVYPERCNQNVYGSVFINGYQVVAIPDRDPDGGPGYLRLREHVPQALPTSPGIWPKYYGPDPEKYTLTGLQSPPPPAGDFPQDGYYVAVFNDPAYGPTTAAINISGGLNNAIFPFRDDTSNTYTATESISGSTQSTQDPPLSLGTDTLQGNSAKCPLDLSYETQKVADLVVDIP